MEHEPRSSRRPDSLGQNGPAGYSEGPASSSADGDVGDAGDLPELVSEFWTLSTEYVKQETLDPLKRLGRYVGLGLAGGLLLGLGALFLAIGLLRLLQEEVGFFQDHKVASAIPYAIVLVGIALTAAIVWWVGTSQQGKSSRLKKE